MIINFRPNEKKSFVHIWMKKMSNLDEDYKFNEASCTSPQMDDEHWLMEGQRTLKWTTEW